jgi:hypothetical protein
MSHFDFDTVPVTIQHEENSTFTETYGFVGSQGLVVLEGIHFIPRDHPSNTVGFNDASLKCLTATAHGAGLGRSRNSLDVLR